MAGSNKRVQGHMKQINSFLSALDGYDPTVPDAVTRFFMQRSGCDADDPRMVRLISLAADHFLARTVHESRQLSLLRTAVNPTTAKKAAAQSSSKTSSKKRKGGAGASGEANAENNEKNKGGKETENNLFQIEDLAMALADQGVHISTGSKKAKNSNF